MRKAIASAITGALLASSQWCSGAVEIDSPQIQRTTPYPGITLTRALTYRTYLVSAHTFAHWRARLESSPLHQAQDAVGLAENSIAYTGQLYSADDGCHPNNLEFTHTIEVTLPDVRIGNLTEREKSIIKMVSDFIANHEQLHVTDYITSMDRLLQRTHELAGTTDCETYKGLISKTLAAEVDWNKVRAQYIDQNSSWAYMESEINKRLANAAP